MWLVAKDGKTLDMREDKVDEHLEVQEESGVACTAAVRIPMDFFKRADR